MVLLIKPVIDLVFRFSHETLCKFIYLFDIVCLCDKAKTTVSSSHKCHHMYEEKKLSSESILKTSKTKDYFPPTSSIFCIYNKIEIVGIAKTSSLLSLKL